MPVTTGIDGPRVIKITPLHIHRPITLAFPTIVTQFQDRWSPNWRDEQVYGRMDPLGFYSGTRRDITLGFRIVSDDINEARQNMANLQKLIQYQYPAFQKRGRVATLKAPPYFKVEFMNAMASSKGSTGLTGYLSSPLNVSPGFQDKQTAQYFDDNFSKLLFSDVEVAFTMVVLHAHEVGFYRSNANFKGGNTYPYQISASPQRTTARGTRTVESTSTTAKTPTPVDAQPAAPPQAQLNANTQAVAAAALGKVFSAVGGAASTLSGLSTTTEGAIADVAGKIGAFFGNTPGGNP